MQKFLNRVFISVLLVMSVSAMQVFAEDEGQFEALSPEFLEWQSEQEADESESGLPSSKNAMPGGHIPFPVDLSHLAKNPPAEESSPYPSRKAASIPSKYDLRDVGGKSYVTSVKNQNPYGTCWAHASIGAIESNMLMKDLGTYDLSEMHIAWYAFRGSDKSKAFNNLHSAAFQTIMDRGGNSFYPAAVFTRLSGPADESDVPYGKDNKPSEGSPDDYERAARLREVFYLNFGDEPNVNASTSARDTIKRRIMENGAVVGNYYNSNSTYNKTESGGTAYYYKTTNKSTNHAIQIIGWDDSYSRSNFKTNPGVDGAWLIKNSWGNEWWTGSEYVGDDGCFWMSYSQYMTEGTAFAAEKADSDMKAYYYDALGWCSTWGYTSGVMYAANVFKSERSGEKLTEVGFITPDNNIDYTISVYTGMSSMPSNSPVPSGASSAPSASGTITYAGYHTVTLDEPVELSEGEYFSVVVAFTNYAKTAVEKKVSSWSDNAVIENGSFFSYDGSSWISGGNRSMNATIKAFTVTGEVSGTAPRIRTDYLPDAYLNQSYSTYLSASGTKPLTWSASGNIPPGLSLNPSTGEFSGTPTSEGNFTLSVTAANENGTSDPKSFTMNVWDIPEIDSEDIPGYVGYTLSKQMVLIPNVPATWSTSGFLPPGVKLGSSGLITGKPTKAGTYNATMKAVSSVGTSPQKDVKFTIYEKPAKPVIKISTLKPVMIGDEFSHDIEVTGTDPITLTIEGQPDGVTLNGSGLLMSGTPSAAGTYNITIKAENIATQLEGKPVTKTVKLTVKARTPVIASPGTLSDAVMGEEYSGVQFSLSDGTEPVTWKVTGHPSGMSISSSGLLSGTPKKAGKFTLTVKATNSGGSGSLRLPLTVIQKPSISTTKIAKATTDKKYTVKLSAKGSTPITWEISGLPDTMTYEANSTGTFATITGTPTEMGDYTLNVKATNSAGSDEKTIALNVAGVAPKLTATLARGAVGAAYDGAKIYAAGTKPVTITYSISESDMAKFGISSISDLGLTFTNDPASGTASLSGTPSVSVRSLPVTFSAVNAASSKAAVKKASFTIMGQKPVFTSPDETAVKITCAGGSSIAMDFTVEGSKNITYSINRVNGFTIEQTDGYSATLTGTAPVKDANTSITVTASNADGKATRKINIKTMTPPEITTETIAKAMIRASYRVKFTASGSKTIAWSITGEIPEGMSLSNGILGGIPTEAGEFTFTLKAENDVGSDEKEFTLTVEDPYTDNGSLPEVKHDESSQLEENEKPDEETVTGTPENDTEATSEPAITFGHDRTEAPQASGLTRNGYIIAAVLPEISVNVSGMYDIEAALYENVPEGAELCWFAYPEEAGKSEDDEIAEFYDEAGAEISTVPSSRKVVVSAWLNEGVKYYPVIAVK